MGDFFFKKRKILATEKGIQLGKQSLGTCTGMHRNDF